MSREPLLVPEYKDEEIDKEYKSEYKDLPTLVVDPSSPEEFESLVASRSQQPNIFTVCKTKSSSRCSGMFNGFLSTIPQNAKSYLT